MTFFDRGCRAFLATQARVPIQLASRFAYLFFRVSRVKWRRSRLPPARRSVKKPASSRGGTTAMWVGLFYSYVNQYELFLASDDEVVALREHLSIHADIATRFLAAPTAQRLEFVDDPKYAAILRTLLGEAVFDEYRGLAAG